MPDSSKTISDNLTSLISGLGTSADPKMSYWFQFVQMQREQLEAAYRSDWIARKAIDIPAHDSTRSWRSWVGIAKDLTVIEKIEKQFQLQHKLRNAVTRARLYGGAALVMGVDGAGTSDQELKPEQVKKGALKFIHVLSRYEITAQRTEYDLNSPYYGEPVMYTYSGTGTNSAMTIHPSRVVRLVGTEVPDRRLTFDGWGDSILQAIDESVKAAGIVTSSVATMVNDGKFDVIKIPNLTQNLVSDEYTNLLTKRIRLLNQVKSSVNALILDKEEEWNRIQTNFNGLSDLLKLYLLIVCGATDIPATRFLGQSPAGLTATGESDIRNYYDSIAAWQGNVLSPALIRLDEVLLRSALGARPDNLFYNWNSLWQITEAEEADIALKKAQAFKIDVDAAILPSSVLRESRASQLVDDGTYPAFEAEYDEWKQQQADLAAQGTEVNLQATASPDVTAENQNTAVPAATTPKPMMGDQKWRQRLLADAKPRSLYVRRDVVNSKDILAWAKAQGFTTTVPADELHVTITYSREPVDWIKMGNAIDPYPSDNSDVSNLVIAAGGPRTVESLGPDGAIVLMFASSRLCWRHHDMIREGGASWDYGDNYQPHITITYRGAGVGLANVEPYKGEIIFGPEIFEEVRSGFNPISVEQAA